MMHLVLDRFDFKTVHKVLTFLNWGGPDQETLVRMADILLSDAYDMAMKEKSNNVSISMSSAGLEATAIYIEASDDVEALILKCVIEEQDVIKNDYDIELLS